MICIVCDKETKNLFSVKGGLTAICGDCELKYRKKLIKENKSFPRFLQDQFDNAKGDKINVIRW
jgi:hypothetical protein